MSSCAVTSMRGLQNGLFKAVHLRNGMQWGAFYGFTVNVCVSPQPSFFVCKLLATCDCSRFWKKHVKVGVTYILGKVYLIFDQLCNHRGGHHLEWDWAVLGVLFLFWLQRWKKAESPKLPSIHTHPAFHSVGLVLQGLPRPLHCTWFWIKASIQ